MADKQHPLSFELKGVRVLIGKQFRLERATLALGEDGGKRKAVTVPEGAIIKVVSGPKNEDGRVDILWNDRALAMFEVDLNVRGTEIVEKSAGLNRKTATQVEAAIDGNVSLWEGSN